MTNFINSEDRLNLLRIVILSERPGIGVYWQSVLRPVLADNRMQIVGVVVHPRPAKPLKKRLVSFLRRLRGGVFIAMVADKVMKRISRFKTPPQSLTFQEFVGNHSLPIVYVQAFVPDILPQIAAMQGDIMVLAGYHQVVKRPLIDLFPRGLLSYHYGDMRKYRGQPPVFWELLHGEVSVGVTVQKLSLVLDAGCPVEEVGVPVELNASLSQVKERVLTVSLPLMHRALSRFLDPGYIPARLPAHGVLYTFPDIFSWLKMLWLEGVKKYRR